MNFWQRWLSTHIWKFRELWPGSLGGRGYHAKCHSLLLWRKHAKGGFSKKYLNEEAFGAMVVVGAPCSKQLRLNAQKNFEESPKEPPLQGTDVRPKTKKDAECTKPPLCLRSAACQNTIKLAKFYFWDVHVFPSLARITYTRIFHVCINVTSLPDRRIYVTHPHILATSRWSQPMLNNCRWFGPLTITCTLYFMPSLPSP